MILYGIETPPPLICELRMAHYNVTQPCYEDNAGSGGTFEALQDHMREFLVRGPLQGYFLETTRRILVVFPRNFQQSKEHFRGVGVQVVTVILYLGGFIGDQESEKL